VFVGRSNLSVALNLDNSELSLFSLMITVTLAIVMLDYDPGVDSMTQPSQPVSKI
jgi:hypothetical protein